jgi:hypothetical protein
VFEDGPANVVADIQQLVGFENRFHGGHFILLMAWADWHGLKTPGRASIADTGNSERAGPATAVRRGWGRPVESPLLVQPTRRSKHAFAPALRRFPAPSLRRLRALHAACGGLRRSARENGKTRRNGQKRAKNPTKAGQTKAGSRWMAPLNSAWLVAAHEREAPQGG